MDEQEDVVVSETEALRQELADMRKQLDEVKSRQSIPDPGVALAKYKLNENETEVLRLMSLGLNQTESSRLAGRSDDYAKRRLNDSTEFAKAYQEVIAEFKTWQDARLRFTLPEVWREIDLILNDDPAPYIADGNTDYAKAILKAKTTIIDKLLHHSYAEQSEIIHKHEVDIPMLQVAQENLGLLAEHMQALSLMATRGELERRLPENQIIDLLPQQHVLRFNKQSRREDGRFRCAECGTWITRLEGHVSLQHNMTMKQYVVKHNIDPLEPFDEVGDEVEDVESIAVDA